MKHEKVLKNREAFWGISLYDLIAYIWLMLLIVFIILGVVLTQYGG